MPRGVKGPGTQRRQQQLSPEELRAKRAELHDELARLEAQDKERYAAIGRAVEKEAESDPKLAEQLRGILERNVTDRGERMCLGLTTTRRGGRRPRAMASPAGMQDPITSGAGPTAPDNDVP
jgi:hypothetical protein